MREKILVSACLVGVSCRYDGKSKEQERVLDFLKDKDFILICPEIMGGLKTPRESSEIKNGKVYNKIGEDVTYNFIHGAEETLKLAKKFNIRRALLKSKSPSCGHGKIYDGTFQNNLVDGNGITAQLLIKNGLTIMTEEDI